MEYIKVKELCFGKFTSGFPDGLEIVYEKNRKLRYLLLYTPIPTIYITSTR